MSTENRQSILSFYPNELKEVMADLGEKPYRAAQVFSWLHEKGAQSYGEMTNLSKSLRQRLEEEYPLHPLRVVQELRSRQDGTRKYLFALEDGNVIESVRMPYEHGISVCISSQVGCRMGCRFCASTIDGLVRSLTAAEMLGQVYAIRAEESGKSLAGTAERPVSTQAGGEKGTEKKHTLPQAGGAGGTGKEQKSTEHAGRVSHVVIMGSGEPLDNYDEVVRFIRLLSTQEGAQISQRNITLSTCGLVPEIRRLAEEKLAITLAISLHAPNDEKRRKLMPIANRYSLKELMPACRDYFEATGRRLTFEYALVAGENDSEADAAELAALIRGLHAHVNLIPVNPVKERAWRRSPFAQVMKFQKKLEKYGINVTIRREWALISAVPVDNCEKAISILTRRIENEGIFCY